MIRRLRKLYYRIFVRYKRLELIYVDWRKADSLIKQNQNGPEDQQWHIAKEEDTDRTYSMVYLERKIRITQ